MPKATQPSTPSGNGDDGEGGRAGYRRRLTLSYALLIGANIGAWAWALVAFRQYPLLLGTALLAYGLGLRHAVDADHIAAIDNVTRKLMNDGQRPIGVGLFFSLGHSTVVVAASVAIAATAVAFNAQLPSVRGMASTIGTIVSVSFLFIVATMNVFILSSVYRTFRHVRAGGAYAEEDLNALLAGGGLLARIFRPIFGAVTSSWHMYPVGLLFGLGFDTATEIALLGISAASAGRGMPLWTILVFPALFTAGMALVDTTDSVLMVGAYGWAFRHPVKKLYYNLVMTFVSVVVAILVGAVETLGLVRDRLSASGGFWDAVGGLNSHFGMLGYAIIGVFIVSWAVSVRLYRQQAKQITVV